MPTSFYIHISSDTDSQDIAIPTGRYGESKHDVAQRKRCANNDIGFLVGPNSSTLSSHRRRKQVVIKELDEYGEYAKHVQLCWDYKKRYDSRRRLWQKDTYI